MTEATLRTKGTACGPPEVALITVHWTRPFGPGERGRGEGGRREREERIEKGRGKEGEGGKKGGGGEWQWENRRKEKQVAVKYVLAANSQCSPHF